MKRLKELISKAINKFKRSKEEEPYIKLRDMEIVSQNNIDYSDVVYNIVGYKDRWIDKIMFRQDKRLKEAYQKAIELVKPIRKITPNNISLSKSSNIKIPKSIDHISFRAMMELTAVINQGIQTNLENLMAHTICIVCYSENNIGDYNSDIEAWKTFQEKILDQPLVEMIGLYQWIDKQLTENQLEWEKRFFSVEVEDEDYIRVGGPQKMAQFNVINTVKNLCIDFNITYDRAWQMSYAISQTNNYAKATWSYVQDEMRQVKEAKMRAERDRRG